MQQELSLMTEVKRLIRERGDVTLLQIYDATGVPPGWIQKLMSGVFPNPGVNRIQKLYEYLSGKKLTV